MDSINFFFGAISFLIGMISLVPLLYSLHCWRRKRMIQRFHQSVTPVLHELDRFAGKLNGADRRRLVREFVRMASLAHFRQERPEADAESIRYARQCHKCKFCHMEMKCDTEGGCEDCGLGGRHWVEPVKKRTKTSVNKKAKPRAQLAAPSPKLKSNSKSTQDLKRKPVLQLKSALGESVKDGA